MGGLSRVAECNEGIFSAEKTMGEQPEPFRLNSVSGSGLISRNGGAAKSSQIEEICNTVIIA